MLTNGHPSICDDIRAHLAQIFSLEYTQSIYTLLTSHSDLSLSFLWSWDDHTPVTSRGYGTWQGTPFVSLLWGKYKSSTPFATRGRPPYALWSRLGKSATGFLSYSFVYKTTPSDPRCVHHVSHPPTSAGEMPYSSVTYPVASNLLSSDRSLDTVTLLQVNTSFISHSPPTSSKRTSLVHAENSPGQRNTCCISVTSRLKHFDPFPPLMLPEIFDPERFGLALGLLEYTEEIRVCVKPRMTQELRLE